MHQGTNYPCRAKANERCFFQRAGPGWHKRNDFSNGPGRADKREMSFPKDRAENKAE